MAGWRFSRARRQRPCAHPAASEVRTRTLPTAWIAVDRGEGSMAARTKRREATVRWICTRVGSVPIATQASSRRAACHSPPSPFTFTFASSCSSLQIHSFTHSFFTLLFKHALFRRKEKDRGARYVYPHARCKPRLIRPVAFLVVDIVVLALGQTIAEGTPEQVTSNPLVIEAYLGGSDD